MKQFEGIKDVLLREAKILSSRPIYIFCCIAAPLSCFILFATLMGSGLPVELPVAVVDADNTAFTRKVSRYLGAMQLSDVSAKYGNFTEAAAAMRRGDIYAFYYFPDGTTDALLSQKQPTVSYYMNYSYLAAGSLTYRDMYINSLLTNADVGRATLLARGASEREADEFLQPIVVETHAIGNPWLSYSIYLNNTLFPGVLSLLIFLVTTFSITDEIKRGVSREWIRISRGSITTALIGKLLPQTIIFTFVAIIYNLILYLLLEFPVHDGIWSMILASMLMVAASQCFGVFLASLLPSPRWAMSIASLWGVVSFSISGFSFPAEGMSGAIRTLSNLFPLRHYFMIYCNQALLGTPISNAFIHYAALLVFCLLPAFVIKRLKKALLHYPYIP